MEKTTLHYFRTGSIRAAETTLSAMSAAGWQPVRIGRLLQHYRFDDSTRLCYRIGYCAAAPGSAERLAFTAAQERAGWHCCGTRRGWLLFGRPADVSGEPLAGATEGIAALFAGRIRRRETARLWLVLLAAALLIGGYLTDCLPVLYAFTAPMLVMLLLTYQIKFMQEAVVDSSASEG